MFINILLKMNYCMGVCVVCLFVCVCADMNAYMFMSVCGAQRSVSGVFLNGYLLIFEIVSHLTWNMIWLDRPIPIRDPPVSASSTLW